MPEKVVPHWMKFLEIMMVGIATLVVTNFTRVLFGDLDHFQITKEGLNVAIILFTLGAAIIGVFSSNADRPVFGKYVVYIGLCCAAFVFFAYDKNIIAVAGFLGLVLTSGLMVAKIRVPYP